MPSRPSPPSRSSTRCGPVAGSGAAPLDRRPRHGPRRRHRPRRPRRRRWSPSRWPAARCATRSRTAVTGAVTALDGVGAVGLDFTVMTDDEREALRQQPPRRPGAPPAGHAQAHGHAEGRAIPFAEPGSKTRPLLIASGKGGVGKCSVTTNLAVALAQRGPLGRRGRRRRLRLLHPPDARHRPRPGGHRRACCCRPSSGACAASRSATSCPTARPSSGGARCCTRPSSSSSPTSTGTTPTSCSSTCRRAPATSPSRSASTCPGPRCTSSPRPQPAAQQVARLSAAMAEQGAPGGARASSRTCRGSPVTTASATSSSARGGGQELADELGVPLLGQIPLVPPLREGGDDGRRSPPSSPDSEAAAHVPRRWPSASPSS